MTWCASTPHHITSVFVPERRESLEESGSIGAGIAVEPRLTACLGGTGGGSRYTTVARVAALLGRPELAERVSIRTVLPPGAGYAVSAAAAITAGLVMARSLGLGFRSALSAAHKAEILESTGLGDVLAISCGVGVVVRIRPGAPGVGETECFQFPGTIQVISVETGREHTSGLLARVSGDFVEKARIALDRIINNASIESFIEWSEWFSRESGMLRIALEGVRLPRIPGLIGYYAKKRVVVFFVEREWSHDAAQALYSIGLEPRLLSSSTHGPSLWWRERWVA